MPPKKSNNICPVFNIFNLPLLNNALFLQIHRVVFFVRCFKTNCFENYLRHQKNNFKANLNEKYPKIHSNFHGVL